MELIPWCFMNHSCKPNILDRWNTLLPAKLRFIKTEATRDIAKGEELTYDYAREYYNYEPQFDCWCGVESCRGIMRGFNGLSREQQKRLLLLASPHIQKKYRRERILEYVKCILGYVK